MIHRQLEVESARAWAIGACECGAVSKHVLPSLAGRTRWWKAHRLDARMDALLDEVDA